MQANTDDFIQPASHSVEKLPGTPGKLKTLLKGGLLIYFYYYYKLSHLERQACMAILFTTE